MTESYVLRVASAPLAQGRLAGEVEHVATGERGRVRDADELLAFVHRTCPGPLDPSTSAATTSPPKGPSCMP